MKFNLEEVIETLNSEKLSLNFNRNTIFRFVTYKKKKLPHILQKILKRWKLPHHFLYKIDTNINFFINKYCFGDFLSIIKRDKPDLSIIEVFMFDKKNYKSSFNNLTWMNTEQIKEHLEYLQNSIGLDFYFKVKKSSATLRTWEGYPVKNKGISVKINFKSLNFIEIKYVLFWLRYTYEFPGNLALIDAYLLKEKYPEEELHNLLIIPSRLLNNTNRQLPPDQSISIFGRFVNEGRIKNYLKKGLNVINIYGGEQSLPELNKIIGSFHKNFTTNYVDYSQWLNDESRWEIYERMYQYYKETRIIEVENEN